MHDASKDKRLKRQIVISNKEKDMGREELPDSASQEKKEESTMTKTMKIEGMMCGHCEARVKKCLEVLPQVDEAAVSHEAGTAVLTLNAEVADDVLKKTVEDQDYQVLGIE